MAATLFDIKYSTRIPIEDCTKFEAWGILNYQYQYVFRFEKGIHDDDYENQVLENYYKIILRETNNKKVQGIRKRLEYLIWCSKKYWHDFYLEQYIEAIQGSDELDILMYWDLWNRLRVVIGFEWLEPKNGIARVLKKWGEFSTDPIEKKVYTGHLELFDRLAEERER